MRFCHIAPVPHLDLVQNRSAHLTLAHLIDADGPWESEGHEEYIQFYQQEAAMSTGEPYVNIMDNSGFELYKAQLPMFPPEKSPATGACVTCSSPIFFLSLSEIRPL